MAGEGGGPNPPYKESFLENIVAVGWGGTGGIFVSGDFCCYQRYTRLEDNKSMDFGWFGLGSMAFGDLGGTESSTYGKTAGGPVFLLGGHRGGEYDANVLMRSTDGYKWQAQGVGPVIYTDNLVFDWDEKRFYAAGPSATGACAYSSDGIYWFISGTPFEKHCKGIMPGVPDGVYGYDYAHDLLIYPMQGEAFAVVNASQSDAEEFPVFTGLTNCFTIAYVGGVWMAGGGGGMGAFDMGSVTTCSLDGGNFWFYSTVGDLGMTGDYAVTTMVSAPNKHFRGRSTAPTTYQKAQTGTAVTPPPTLMSAEPPPTLVTMSAPPLMRAVPTLFGGTNASGPQRSKFGTLASAIAPSRRPRARLRRAYRHI
jgi:hypothetical protein